MVWEHRARRTKLTLPAGRVFHSNLTVDLTNQNFTAQPQLQTIWFEDAPSAGSSTFGLGES